MKGLNLTTVEWRNGMDIPLIILRRRNPDRKKGWVARISLPDRNSKFDVERTFIEAHKVDAESFEGAEGYEILTFRTDRLEGGFYEAQSWVANGTGAQEPGVCLRVYFELGMDGEIRCYRDKAGILEAMAKASPYAGTFHAIRILRELSPAERLRVFKYFAGEIALWTKKKKLKLPSVVRVGSQMRPRGEPRVEQDLVERNLCEGEGIGS